MCVEEKTITVKIAKSLHQRSRKHTGRLKLHRDFVHIVNYAVNLYLNSLEKKVEENKSE